MSCWHIFTSCKTWTCKLSHFFFALLKRITRTMITINFPSLLCRESSTKILSIMLFKDFTLYSSVYSSLSYFAFSFVSELIVYIFSGRGDSAGVQSVVCSPIKQKAVWPATTLYLVAHKILALFYSIKAISNQTPNHPHSLQLICSLNMNFLKYDFRNVVAIILTFYYWGYAMLIACIIYPIQYL